jgi:hypothetical protein
MTDWFRSDHAGSLTQLDAGNLRVTNPALRAADEERALRLLAKGQSRVFQNCGHLIHAERANEDNDAIERFLAMALS